MLAHRAQLASLLKVSFCFCACAHLPYEILVFDHAKVPACGLGDPLPRYKVAHHHRSWTNADYRVGKKITRDL